MWKWVGRRRGRRLAPFMAQLATAFAAADRRLDFSAESLVVLDALIFKQLRSPGSDRGAAAYFGEVLRRHIPSTSWIMSDPIDHPVLLSGEWEIDPFERLGLRLDGKLHPADTFVEFFETTRSYLENPSEERATELGLTGAMIRSEASSNWDVLKKDIRRWRWYRQAARSNPTLLGQTSEAP